MTKKEQLIVYLSECITGNRAALFQKLIYERTRFLTVVLEDIFQSHNASAVIRSCDCFGIQDVHIIEKRNSFTVNTEIDMGSSKWLDLTIYNKEDNSTLSTIETLRKKGYRIVATVPDSKAVSLENFDLSKGKTALLFGTELTGLSDLAIQNSDEFLTIPMYGFTESLNISVSVALILHYLTMQLRSSKIQWHLSPEDMLDVHLNWLRAAVKNSKKIENEFWKRVS